MFRLLPESRGSVSVTALIVMTVLCIVGAAFVTLSSTEVTIAAYYRDGIAAQYLAEAGAQWALARLKTKDTKIVAEIESKGSYKATSSTKNSGATTGIYQVTITNPDYPKDNSRRQITSIGTITGSNAKRTVVLQASGGSAVYSGSGIIVNSNGKIIGDATTTGSITVNNGGSITGNRNINTQDLMPTFGSINYSSNPQIGPNVNSSETVTLTGMIYYVNGDFNVGGTLYHTAGGKVTIYVKGNLNINSGAKFDGAFTIVAGGSISVNQHESSSLDLIALGSNDSQVNSDAVLNGSIIAKGKVLVNGTVNHVSGGSGFQIISWKNQ